MLEKSSCSPLMHTETLPVVGINKASLIQLDIKTMPIRNTGYATIRYGIVAYFDNRWWGGEGWVRGLKIKTKTYFLIFSKVQLFFKYVCCTTQPFFCSMARYFTTHIKIYTECVIIIRSEIILILRIESVYKFIILRCCLQMKGSVRTFKMCRSQKSNDVKKEIFSVY